MKLDTIKASELQLATETDQRSSLVNDVLTAAAEPLSADFFERNERSMHGIDGTELDCKGSSTQGMMSLDQGDNSMSVNVPFAPLTSSDQVKMRTVMVHQEKMRNSYNMDIRNQMITNRSKFSQQGSTGRGAQETIRVENHSEDDRPFVMDAD